MEETWAEDSLIELMVQIHQDELISMLHALSMTLCRVGVVSPGYVDDMGYRLVEYWM